MREIHINISVPDDSDIDSVVINLKHKVESKEGCNITQGIKLSEQYGELLSKTTQSYTCTRRR